MSKKSTPRPPIVRRKKNRDYKTDYASLLRASVLVAQARDVLRETGATQTRAAAARLSKSLEGAIKHARRMADGEPSE